MSDLKPIEPSDQSSLGGEPEFSDDEMAALGEKPLKKKKVKKPRNFNSKKIAQMAIALMILVGFALLMVSYYWSRSPAVFDVEATAYEAHNITEPPPAGVITVATLIHICETLLEKPGGYLYNDRMPPGAWLDNMPNWEKGVLIEIRTFTGALRQDISRSQAQSPERPEIVQAEGHLSFDYDAWFMPSSESEYRAGIRELNIYLNNLRNLGDDRATITVRGDSLASWLRQVERRLGSLAAKLRKNAGVDKYDVNAMTSHQEGEAQDLEQHHWREVDDVFFEARGSSWAIYHLLKAIKIDFEPLINQQLALGPLNRTMSHLNATQKPIHSPVIMNGEEFGIIPNHSLTLAAHIVKAQVNIGDFRPLISGDMSGN